MWESHNETANGWAAGESSFMTDRKPDSKGSNVADRLPVPATITMLRERIDESDDKYVLGGYHFSTVTTVGIVKDIQENDTTYTYTLGDPNNLDVEFSAAKFVGDADSKRKFDSSSIVEGTRVRAIGKLKGFNGSSSIMCFIINPVENDKDFKIFELEAEASRLFFSKNMSDKLRLESASSFTGMLAPPKSRTPGVSQQNSANSDTKERLYKQDQKPAVSGNSIDARIKSVLSAIPQDDRETGQEISWIMQQIGATDEKKIREVLVKLVESGEVYTTTDDDHFSCI